MEDVVLRKVTVRLIPFMFALYVVAYLDRINVGFAALQMKPELGFSDAVYGLGAGIFFIGYFLFEIPSNLILERVGARLWIARIMVTWGVISCAMMFVRTPISFYLVRFLLGVAEAGFFPGMILYLTYWFPAAQRARAVARFMTATALAGVVGGPISGWILGLHGAAGLSGWQWLFLLEGIPAVVLGVVVLWYLPDRPEHAGWLAPSERDWLAGRLAEEGEQASHHSTRELVPALVSGAVWLLGLLYFVLIVGFYGISMWLPLIIKGFSGLDDWQVGLMSAVPYLAAAVCMVLVGSHSDRTHERRLHVAIPAFVAAAGLALSAALHSPALGLLSLSLAAAGIWSALGPFWTIPTDFLSGTAAAGGIALVNSVGNLGGFIGPYAVGLVKSATHSFAGGLLALSAALVAAGALALWFGPGPRAETGATLREGTV